MGHLIVPEGGVLGEDLLKQCTQRRDVPLAIPQVIEKAFSVSAAVVLKHS